LEFHIVVERVDNPVDGYLPTFDLGIDSKGFSMRPPTSNLPAGVQSVAESRPLGAGKVTIGAMPPHKDSGLSIEIETFSEEGSSDDNIYQFRSPFVSIGDLAALVVADAAVRLRGNFQLPRIVALAAWED